MAEISIAQLKGGETLKNMPVMLKNLKRSGDRFLFQVSDSSSTLNGFCSAKLYSYEQIQGLTKIPIYISGLVKPGLGDKKPEIKVKSIEKAEQTEETLKMTTPVLSDEKIDFYLDRIKLYAGSVKCAGYRQLLDAFFSPANLKIMRTMPATHTRHASIYGGMLHQIAAVTAMAVGNANMYLKYSNDMYSFSDNAIIDYDLLITGSLMHLAGNILYFTNEIPHRKTDLGVNQGFASCEMAVIYSLIREHDVVMSDDEISSLLGVVNQCNEFCTGVKACCLEAKILKGSFSTFKALDVFDHAIYDAVQKCGVPDSEDGMEDFQTYLYSSDINCYASYAVIKKKSEALEKKTQTENK